MFSHKLRRGAAVLGVFAIGGLGLLAPTAAMAEDDPVTVDVSAVKIGKTVISNQTIIDGQAGNKSRFTFDIAASPCTFDGCVSGHTLTDKSGNEYIAYGKQYDDGFVIVGPSRSVTVYADATGKVYSGSLLPPASSYTEAGIYQWVVKEKRSTTGFTEDFLGYLPNYFFSQAQYTIRAAVKQDGDGFAYNWITIIKDKNDDGTPNGDKVDNLDFVNVALDLGTLEVTKRVVNNSGVNEVGPYDMKAVITLPDNFNGVASGDKWTTNLPALKLGNSSIDGNEATDGNCSNGLDDNNKPIFTCTFTLDKDKKAVIVNVPVGSTYTVTELSTNDKYKTTYTNASGTIPFGDWLYPAMTEEECVAANNPPTLYTEWVSETDSLHAHCLAMTAEQAQAVVTNTYENVTPTGLALEYLPYALMIIIPLAGIGAYVAAKRKLLA